MPFIGVIIVLVIISTASLSTYYGIIKPMLSASKHEKNREEEIKKKDNIIKSWINCAPTDGIEGSGVYTVKTSLLKELDIYNMESSFNVIKFKKEDMTIKVDDKIHNVGLDNVLEITIKNLGRSRITCRDIIIYYVKDRIRLESKVMQKKRIIIVSENGKSIKHETSRDVLPIDFGNYISIVEPEMKTYQIHHITFDLYSNQTVPIIINVLMKNRDYMLLSCSYRNVLTLSFIDDLSIIGGCVKNSGHVSALIESRDLSTGPNNYLPINLRSQVPVIIDDTIPTHYGLTDITKITITNDGPEIIAINELGYYYFNTTSNLIKYTVLNIDPISNNIILVNLDINRNVSYTITTPIPEIFEIKMIVTPENLSSRIFIDLYKDETNFRRISTCVFNNIVHLTLFREAGSNGVVFNSPSTSLPIAATGCSDVFNMNGYHVTYENELLEQYPTIISFNPQKIIDIEGMIPDRFGITITKLELYSDDTVNIPLDEVTVYYIHQSLANGIRKYKITTSPITPSTLISLNINLPEITDTNYQIYRIKIKTSNANSFFKCFLKMKTPMIDYIVSFCTGINTLYLDVVGLYPISVKSVCNNLLRNILFAKLDLSKMNLYSKYEPSTSNIIEPSYTKIWQFSGSELKNTEPGNIRNPIYGLYIITINSDIYTLVNNYIGIYYKRHNESKIQYKKLDRYLVNNYKIGNKLDDNKPVIINNDKYLMCMDDYMGSYEIYEIELEMNNIDWSQVHINLINQSGNMYKNILCMKNNKINLTLFGKTGIDVIIRSMMNCSDLMSGTTYYSDIVLNNIKYNREPYIEYCYPLILTKGNPLGLLTSDKLGFPDILNISLVNIGNVKINIIGIKCYYTNYIYRASYAGASVNTISFNIYNDTYKSLGTSTILNPGLLYIVGSIINFDNKSIQRIEFTTDSEGISQLELAIYKKVRDSQGSVIMDSNGDNIFDVAIFAFCISKNTLSINFV